MDILLSQRALEHHRELLEAAAPDPVRWIELHDDASASIDGQPIELRSTTPEVAWLSTELFQDQLTRPFFGLLTRVDSLRWLHSSAAGFDNPVFGRLLERGVRLTPSHIAGGPIGDFVLRAALDHLQRADEWREAATERDWRPHEFTEMGETRWLVVGLGTIGTSVAVRARACGAHVTGVRRSPDGTEPVDAIVTPDQLPTAVGDADVIVVATPATATTSGLVDRELLSGVKPGALLINVGRGSLVDEPALIEALDAGILSRAVLDVTAAEPLPAGDPLWDHPKVVITPHSSALGSGRHRRAATAFAENLARYVRDEPLLHEVGLGDLAG